MEVYRWVWRVAWLLIGSVPVGLGLLEASPAALFCLGTIAAMVVAATGQSTATWFLSGLLGAAVVAGLWSAGAAGVGLLVLALVTAPFVVVRIGGVFGRHRRRRRESTRFGSEVGRMAAAPVLSADVLAGPVHALEDDQLCVSWSESFVALKLTRTLDERLELVNLRQAYLDEFESRNPKGFESWLRSGARPIGRSPQSLSEAGGLHRGSPSNSVEGQSVEGSSRGSVDQAGDDLGPGDRGRQES